VLECVINISEGRDAAVLAALADDASAALLDVHTDPGHNRSVFTLAGVDVEAAARALTATAVARLDLGRHHGVHPRIGVVDVIPFVPLAGSSLDDAVAARDRFAAWAAAELALPCFLYGPGRALPEVRRRAFVDLSPDVGPATPHPTAGASAVGARPVLVAYNLWLEPADVAVARSIAAELRSPDVRALGLTVGDGVQVSLNLVNPERFGPAAAFDAVASRSAIARAELVGLLPASVLAGIPEARWHQLDVEPSRTIEARLEQAGLNGGSGGGAAGGSWNAGDS
jgi:glutamate formiminotransferase/glutamate formiminotransferase/formiminotetrahydrofolate cyclodeaminase